ncbi:uncharacterized protein [Physcomitrium patens]|uniref:uncharacterized protein n=1 Tax=Physcomitrium patens TaxID=3218 RepID=UPI003CCCCA10
MLSENSAEEWKSKSLQVTVFGFGPMSTFTEGRVMKQEYEIDFHGGALLLLANKNVHGSRSCKEGELGKSSTADLEGQYDLSITSEAFSVTRFSDGQGAAGISGTLRCAKFFSIRLALFIPLNIIGDSFNWR